MINQKTKRPTKRPPAPPPDTGGIPERLKSRTPRPAPSPHIQREMDIARELHRDGMRWFWGFIVSLGIFVAFLMAMIWAYRNSREAMDRILYCQSQGYWNYDTLESGAVYCTEPIDFESMSLIPTPSE